MVLSDRMILRKLSEGAIVIEPFDKKYINPVSVDLTLAPTFKVYKQGILDPKVQN